jgi:predicted nucleic acid-binding Zn ribbon protein
MPVKKKCIICQTPFQGRTDKIYCSIECKRAADYEKRRTDEALFFQIDKQLKTNRKILKKYNRVGMTSLRQEVLHKEGFNPNYFTNYWKNPKGDIYLFVYDFGFLKLKDNNKEKYLIVQWQEYMDKGFSKLQ